MILKKGMKVKLLISDPTSEAKKGDTLIVTQVKWPNTDWEIIRVRNEKYSWRISPENIKIIK